MLGARGGGTERLLPSTKILKESGSNLGCCRCMRNGTWKFGSMIWEILRKCDSGFEADLLLDCLRQDSVLGMEVSGL